MLSPQRSGRRHVHRSRRECSQRPQRRRLGLAAHRRACGGEPIAYLASGSAHRASMASVLANFPVALPKSRAWRGLTVCTGRLASASGPAAATCSRAVASSTISVGRSARSRMNRPVIPASSLATRHSSPVGRTATSKTSVATSIPIKVSLPGTPQDAVGSPTTAQPRGCAALWRVTRRSYFD